MKWILNICIYMYSRGGTCMIMIYNSKFKYSITLIPLQTYWIHFEESSKWSNKNPSPKKTHLVRSHVPFSDQGHFHSWNGNLCPAKAHCRKKPFKEEVVPPQKGGNISHQNGKRSQKCLAGRGYVSSLEGKKGNIKLLTTMIRELLPAEEKKQLPDIACLKMWLVPVRNRSFYRIQRQEVANWKISCFSASNNVCLRVKWFNMRQTYNTCGMVAFFIWNTGIQKFGLLLDLLPCVGGRFVRCFFWLP